MNNRSMAPGPVIPQLSYADLGEAVAWLCAAFGFTERLRIANHRSQLLVAGGAVVVVQARPPLGRASVMVRVDDVDAHHRHALAHGAHIVSGPTSYPYGERQYSAQDPAGHSWTFSQSVADVDPADWGGTWRATHVGRHINAPRAKVYRALLDARAVQRWMVPAGMTSQVHEFDPNEGGAFRISLSYDTPTAAGKTTPQTDTFHGRFVSLVPCERVVEVVEFEATAPALRGEMTITIKLSDADGGTELLAIHDRLPPGLSATDNETGWRMSLAKLAALVEAG